MPLARFRGAPLYYADYRHGPVGGRPLVLVHGAGGTHLHWPAPVRRLPDTSVFALDLPGHGRSEGAASARIPEMAEAVLALLDHLRLPQAVVGGHSMGGAIALSLALAHPQRVAGLVLVGSGARLRVGPAILDGLARDYPATVALVIEMAFGPAAPADLKRLAQARMLEVDPPVLRGDWDACNLFDVRDRLGEITAPALVITGQADTLTPEKHARFLAEHLLQAELVLLPGAGHMVMLEQPAAVAAAIRQWLARLPQPRPARPAAP